LTVDENLNALRVSSFFRNEEEETKSSEVIDLFETQEITVQCIRPLVDALFAGLVIWECCNGHGAISRVLNNWGYNVVETDLNFGDNRLDFLSCPTPDTVGGIITNFPYHRKTDFVSRVYELGLPTVALLPIETITVVGCKNLFLQHGVSIGIVHPEPRFIHNGNLVHHPSATAWFFMNCNPFPDIDVKGRGMFVFYINQE